MQPTKSSALPTPQAELSTQQRRLLISAEEIVESITDAFFALSQLYICNERARVSFVRDQGRRGIKREQRKATEPMRTHIVDSNVGQASL